MSATAARQAAISQSLNAVEALGWRRSLAEHWREYLAEAGALGIFMISACGFGALLFHPGSPLAIAFAPFPRMALMGVAMGLTAISIFYSPLGQLSGAHMNPAVTIAFWRLGRVAPEDAAFYIAFQFLGGITGVALARVVFGNCLADSAVNYVATLPGHYGILVALFSEALISFVLMTVILRASGHPELKALTPVFAGSLVALYITFESPLSGMSMNPARTVGSAVFANVWTALWIYFAGPLIGMLAAAQLKALRESSFCAKLYHSANVRCIFCEYEQRRTLSATRSL